MYDHRGVVIHIAQGSYQGTISWQMNPASEVSSHFVVSKGGDITQMVDTDRIAWTQSGGNGYWLSIENEGYVPDRLTDAQLDAQATILARANEVYGSPLQIAYCPNQRGLGHHSMGYECGEDWGHSECPGINIKNQKSAIVEIARGDDVSAQDVWNYDVDPTGGSYSASGATWTTLGRTGYLANTFAPEVLAAIDNLNTTTISHSEAFSALGYTLSEIRDRLAALEQRFGSDPWHAPLDGVEVRDQQ